MNSEQPLKTNLMDVLVLLLKAAVKEYGNPVLRLPKKTVMDCEGADLHMARGLDGTVVLKLIEGQDPDNTKIVLPRGQSPLTLI